MNKVLDCFIFSWILHSLSSATAGRRSNCSSTIYYYLLVVIDFVLLYNISSSHEQGIGLL